MGGTGGLVVANLDLRAVFDQATAKLRAEMGHTTIVGNTGASVISGSVNFGAAFSNIPYVWVTYAGADASSTTWGDNDAQTARIIAASILDLSTSDFKVRLRVQDGTTFPNTNNYFISWLAIGHA